MTVTKVETPYLLLDINAGSICHVAHRGRHLYMLERSARFEWLLIHFVVISQSLVLAACKPATGAHHTTGVLCDPGTYLVDGGRLTIEIVIDKKNIVQYQLLRTSNKESLVQGNAGSRFSRWCVLWSADRSLWIYSGDIGIFKYDETSDGKYEEVNDLPQLMPRDFYDFLPDNSKLTNKPIP